ncbi:hypothetical protein BZK31_08225 [Pseudomonas floridensis]|uniref:Uncharacterized protein n=1 Tax=Pseudomonas floridensis TaxID=1958950 RepID=A0A1X0N906_9PSED|nr:hypothetical protein [Pseudomonas floridensis]MEE4128911.1 hypothetical protein [Pseudomonas viridiflava]MEE4911796.1 hypothetical protein [Pseudomonas alliivorans]ORC60285.1 hypothetical protein BZK31_08225 [Pseudomonas floridensis]
MGFLQWIEAQRGLRYFGWSEDKALYMPEVMTAFPSLREDYESSLAKLNQAKAIRACFNGTVVTAITGLTGKQLGQFMAHFKHDLAEGMADLPSLSMEQLSSLIRNSHEVFVRTVEQSTEIRRKQD